MDSLKQRGIPIVDHTIEDFDRDMKTLSDLWPEVEKIVREPGARRNS
ncbi:MAG: hypothetical protein ACR2NN_00725 [Bryobacteraceae bacterium]